METIREFFRNLRYRSRCCTTMYAGKRRNEKNAKTTKRAGCGTSSGTIAMRMQERLLRVVKWAAATVLGLTVVAWVAGVLALPAGGARRVCGNRPIEEFASAGGRF